MGNLWTTIFYHFIIRTLLSIFLKTLQRWRLRRPISNIRMVLLMDSKIWMTSLIIMFAVRPTCVQDSLFKMSSKSPALHILQKWHQSLWSKFWLPNLVLYQTAYIIVRYNIRIHTAQQRQITCFEVTIGISHHACELCDMGFLEKIYVAIDMISNPLPLNITLHNSLLLLVLVLKPK